MIKCYIRITFGKRSSTLEFEGLFPSTIDAQLGLNETYPNATRIEVKAI